ncbi:MAG: HNH endonuclease [Nanoarchaeota archaeon]
MSDINDLLWGSSRKKKPSSILGSNFNLGLKAPKKTKSFNLGLNSQKKEIIKYERVAPTASQKTEVLMRQKDKCAWPNCQVHFHRDGVPPQFDHIKRVDKGGKSLASNLQALCPNHHQKKTHGENFEKAEKTRQKAKKKENTSPFGGLSFGSPPKRSKSPFGF